MDNMGHYLFSKYIFLCVLLVKQIRPKTIWTFFFFSNSWLKRLISKMNDL